MGWRNIRLPASRLGRLVSSGILDCAWTYGPLPGSHRHVEARDRSHRAARAALTVGRNEKRRVSSEHIGCFGHRRDRRARETGR